MPAAEGGGAPRKGGSAGVAGPLQQLCLQQHGGGKVAAPLDRRILQHINAARLQRQVAGRGGGPGGGPIDCEPPADKLTIRLLKEVLTGVPCGGL